MTNFSIARARAIFAKEFKHVLRDPFMMFMALILPLLIVLILGNAMEFNVRSIKLAFYDGDRTAASRALVDTFGSSGYFKPHIIHNPDSGFDDIVTDNARALLVIPPHFERDLSRGRGADVQVILDGADNTSISAIMTYIGTVNSDAYYKISDMPRYMTRPDMALSARYMFNPELNSRWFAVPGIAAVIIALVSIMLTTLTVCREWERGSMEMLLTTPATTTEIIIGKGLPYAILSFIGFVLVFIVARMVFGVPFVGSLWILGIGTVLFICGYLAMGMLISVSTHRQEVAMQFACIIGLLPTLVLSGFMFPIEYMARGYRMVADIMPATFYMDISRNQFLRGGGISGAWIGLGALLIIAVMLIVLCIVRFKRVLE